MNKRQSKKARKKKEKKKEQLNYLIQLTNEFVRSRSNVQRMFIKCCEIAQSKSNTDTDLEGNL